MANDVPDASNIPFCLSGRTKICSDARFKWVGAAMLLGVWVTGGLFMMLAATASGGGFANPEGIRGSLWIIALSIIPLVTYMLATYDGSLFALLAVTVGALLIWGVHSRGILLPFQRRPR